MPNTKTFSLQNFEEQVSKVMLQRGQEYYEAGAVYSSELLQLYIPALELQGDNATDRSRYAQLVGNMKKIIKAFPQQKEQVIAVAKKLKERYPRRPAMLDELKAVLQ